MSRGATKKGIKIRGPRKNLSGKTFGRLTALSPDRRNRHGFLWRCECECGNSTVVQGTSLTRGFTLSCGCLQAEVRSRKGKSHAISHGHCAKKPSTTYNSWAAMKQRCLNKNNSYYKDYGGRGIKVCDRWIDSFKVFLEDMGERPSGKTLDRINTNDDYYKENCRWATAIIQARNRREGKIFFNGENLTLSEWAERTGVPSGVLSSRLNAGGWSVERSLTTPILKTWSRNLKKRP